MKKILLVGIIALATTSVFAQTSATTNLNINIQPIQSIEVLQNNVTISIVTAQDFQNAASNVGVTQHEPGQLRVVSNQGFNVFASTTSSLMNGSSSISQDNILLSFSNPVAVVPTSTGLAGYTPVANHNLGTQSLNAVISTSSVGGGTTGTLFDVDYKLANVAGIANLPTGSYATVVTYTIAPL